MTNDWRSGWIRSTYWGDSYQSLDSGRFPSEDRGNLSMGRDEDVSPGMYKEVKTGLRRS